MIMRLVTQNLQKQDMLSMTFGRMLMGLESLEFSDAALAVGDTDDVDFGWKHTNQI